MKIYTRTGDDGETGVLGGRVSKSDVRIAAYGTVDELNAHLGVAVAELRASQAQHLVPDRLSRLIELLEDVQRDLFCVGAELAALDPERAGTRMLDDEAVSRLERCIDTWEPDLPPLRNFILPGGTLTAAHLHVARTVCRRAERQVVVLRNAVPAISARLMIYLNRLGDLLFILARRANVDMDQAEATWQGESGRSDR